MKKCHDDHPMQLGINQLPEAQLKVQCHDSIYS